VCGPSSEFHKKGGGLRSYLEMRDRRLTSARINLGALIDLCSGAQTQGSASSYIGSAPSPPTRPGEGLAAPRTYVPDQISLALFRKTDQPSPNRRYNPHHRARRAVYS
jgi:hypothetical protein